MWPGLSTTLTGERVVLEPLAERHADGLRAAACSGDPAATFRWMPVRLDDPGIFDGWFAQSLAALADGTEAPFATIDRASGTVLGSTRFMALRPWFRSAEIGWTWLTPSAWRTGANIEAKKLMMSHAFETLGFIRVELKTDALNERSRGAMAALPAQFEGIHRQHMIRTDGTYRDSAWFSVIDGEWPAVRANLERRLAALPA